VNRRLQNKCLFASAAMHALLILIVCVAPAFLPEKPRANTPVINLVSARELDALLRAAEAPAAPAPAALPTPAPVAPAVVEPAPTPKAVEPPRPVVPTPPPPAPTPKPAEPVKMKEAAKEPPPKPAKVEPRPLPVTAKGKEAAAEKPKEPDPKAVATKPAPTKDTPTKSTIKIADTGNLVSHKADAEAKAKQKANAEERARADAAAKAVLQAHIQRVAKMKSILGGVQGGLSSPVDIHIDAGGGPNAQAFLDYGQMMVRIYEQAWLVPPNLSDTLAVVGVTVTVARNGRVLEWDLRKPSGNSAIDKSVRETLQKVFQFEPFPASFREPQRTFNIDFNLKAKRTTG
jgi:TonB family protein